MPTKISALPAASTLTGTETVPLVQSSTTKGGLISQIGTYVRALFTTTPATLAEGGTGAATAATARSSLGVVAIAGDTMTGGIIFKAGLNNVASATPDLSAAGANTVHVTGTTGITAFTMTSGQVVDLVFDGILALTHHATNNNLPGAADITTAAGDRARYWYDGTTKWCVDYQKADGTAVAVAASKAVPMRQTVLGGPVDTSGYPSFLPATAGGLSITAQNISSTFPFVATAAAGFGSSGAADRVGQTTSNSLTWGGLTNTTTNYLYVDVATDGTLTTGSTTLAPIYNWGGNTGGAPYTTSGQNVYNIQEGKMYVGPTPTQVYRVFVGEAVTSGGTVTSTVAYAYQGRYDSGWTATLPNSATSVSKNSNLGVYARNRAFVIENTTTDAGYAVGDQLEYTGAGGYNGVNISGPAVWVTANTVGGSFGGSSCIAAIPKGGGASAAVTAANWKYKFIADRGW